MTLAEVEQFVASLPEVVMMPHFDKKSFRVRGRIFATVPADEEHLHILLGAVDAPEVVATNPQAFEELWWGRRLAGVRVKLAACHGDEVLALLEESWRRKAPEALVRSWSPR